MSSSLGVALTPCAVGTLGRWQLVELGKHTLFGVSLLHDLLQVDC